MGVRVCFDGEVLQFRPAGGATEERRVAAADLDRLAKSAAAYDTALKTGDPTPLAGLGRDLFDWLDGDRHWLKALREGAGPRELTIEVGAEPGEAERRFLDAPWELLADGHGLFVANEARPPVLCRGPRRLEMAVTGLA